MGKVTIDYKDLKNLIEDGFLKTKKYKRKNNGKRYKFSKNEIKRAVRLRDAYNQQKSSSNHMQGSMITQPQMNHNMDTQNAIAIREAVQKMNGLNNNQVPAIENGPNRFDDKIKPIMDRLNYMDNKYTWSTGHLAGQFLQMEDNVNNYMHGGNANKPTTSTSPIVEYVDENVNMSPQVQVKTRFSDIDEEIPQTYNEEELKKRYQVYNFDADDDIEYDGDDENYVNKTDFDDIPVLDENYEDKDDYTSAEKHMYDTYTSDRKLKSNLVGQQVFDNPISSELKFVPNQDKGFAEVEINEEEILNSRFDDSADLYNYDSSPIGEFSKNDFFVGDNSISLQNSPNQSAGLNNSPLSVSVNNNKLVMSPRKELQKIDELLNSASKIISKHKEQKNDPNANKPPLSVSVNNPPSMSLKNEEQKEIPKPKVVIDKPKEKSNRLRGLDLYNNIDRLKTEITGLGGDYDDNWNRIELHNHYKILKKKADKAAKEAAKEAKEAEEAAKEAEEAKNKGKKVKVVKNNVVKGKGKK